MAKVNYSTVENWSGGPGLLLISDVPVELKEGDNYVSQGISGLENIFSYGSKDARKARKVLAVSLNFEWNYSGNNTLKKLPKLDF